MICGSRGSKSRLAKAAGAETAGQMRDNKLIQIARRCGAKHIFKSIFTKHTNVGPLLEVAMSKKCTPLWREAHFQVKTHKAPHVRTTFGSWDVETVHAVLARSTFHHISKPKCTKHTSLGALLEVEMSKKYPGWNFNYKTSGLGSFVIKYFQWFCSPFRTMCLCIL